MHTKQKSHIFKRFFTSRWFFVVILGIIGLLLFGYARTYYRDYKVKQEIASLEAEVKNLEKKKFQSMELLNYVTSDSFVEEKARTELNLKKPGEHVVVLPNLSSSTFSVPSDTPVSPDSLQEKKNPIKWWYYFTHRPLP